MYTLLAGCLKGGGGRRGGRRGGGHHWLQKVRGST